MSMKRILFFSLIIAFSLTCSNNKSSEEEEDRASFYSNPVVNYSLPDPTIIRSDDGYFYLYATEDIRNIPIRRSKNLVDWQPMGTAFTEATRPTFEVGGGLWAPDINKIGDKYVLYYSMSKWGGEWSCGIGVATSPSARGPFTDLGKMFRSDEIGVQNSIDPFYVENQGQKHLFWGSFRGIYHVLLSDDGLTVAEGSSPSQIVGTAYEGVYIHKRDNYYYLFASIGRCCEGLNSTYETVVGRSTELMGPYLNRDGNDMMHNNHELLITHNSAFLANGHNAELIRDDVGDDWILYHGVQVSNPQGRVLLLDKIVWKDGWPSIDGGSPSVKSTKPVFN